MNRRMYETNKFAIRMHGKKECIEILNFLNKHGFHWESGRPIIEFTKSWDFYGSHGTFYINYFNTYGVVIGLDYGTLNQVIDISFNDFKKLFNDSIILTKQDRKRKEE